MTWMIDVQLTFSSTVAITESTFMNSAKVQTIQSYQAANNKHCLQELLFIVPHAENSESNVERLRVSGPSPYVTAAPRTMMKETRMMKW